MGDAVPINVAAMDAGQACRCACVPSMVCVSNATSGAMVNLAEALHCLAAGYQRLAEQYADIAAQRRLLMRTPARVTASSSQGSWPASSLRDTLPEIVSQLAAPVALDGVVGKRTGGSYAAGERAMVRSKRLRSADCVVGGFRYAKGDPGGRVVASRAFQCPRTRKPRGCRPRPSPTPIAPP